MTKYWIVDTDEGLLDAMKKAKPDDWIRHVHLDGWYIVPDNAVGIIGISSLIDPDTKYSFVVGG